jgi:hypothetical protein
MRSKVIFGLSAAKQGFATLRRLDMSNCVCVMICTIQLLFTTLAIVTTLRDPRFTKQRVTIGLKRHYPARGRVSAGWRPGSGFNNAVPSMVGSLEVVRSGLGWDPLMGRRLGPSADEQRASVCARARARCQWRQLANYTGRLHPIADVGHP